MNLNLLLQNHLQQARLMLSSYDLLLCCLYITAEVNTTDISKIIGD